ncbi:hypothetical protein F2Q69_00054961 [Brassica cretica]|uniref:Uncharacterized protein n=1 Tax=Brassica cretica TaxID=69181 RepID=A0A8S9N1J5_BRACR|nr:hypothetical protein F2Q69_00054961 [Brassica cretica]
MFNLLSFALVLVLFVAAYLLRAKQNLPPSPAWLLSSRSRHVSFRSGGVLIITTLYAYVLYNNTAVSVAPYGDHWRNLRRICTVEIFSAARLKESFEIRRDEVRSMLQTIHAAATLRGNNSVRMELRPLLSGFTLNVIMRMVAGKRYYGEENAEAKELKELISETFELGGFTYVGDFLPIVKLFDFDGYVKRAKKLGLKLDKYVQKLVDEHRRNRGKKEFNNTMITHLLTLQETQPELYTDENIKGLVLVMLFAGSDTTSVTLEWAMANLLNHPDVLVKVKTEPNNIVSREGRLMEESDTSTCTYLNNVISEILRLYPAAPLLVPHASSRDCKVAGRACPGMGLAQLVLGLALGSLIQCFDWERDEDVAVDMSEGKGLTMPKALSLVAKCKSSSILDSVVI